MNFTQEIEDRVLQNLKKLVNKSGYELIQRNGQRHYGPPPNWIGPPPVGCEVFIGKLPRDLYEDELVPVFERIGMIYELRLMMDFSGFNRGFGFVRYTNEEDACKAVELLNRYKIRGGNSIVVSKSLDNNRLYVGGLPLDASKEEILKEFGKLVPGIVDVVMYPCPRNPSQNRGYVFLHFDSHHSAALARRALIPGPLTSFGDKLVVDWAEPEPVVGKNVMKQVKILFLRNLTTRTTENDILKTFSRYVDLFTIERIKKVQDFAFVHFTTRENAEKAMRLLKCCTLDGFKLELKWGRPADKIYAKNIRRGSTISYISTESKSSNEYVTYEKQNAKPLDSSINNFGIIGQMPENNNYVDNYIKSAPDILEDYCKRLNWGTPKYEFRYGWVSDTFCWGGSVLLQAVQSPNCCPGTPLVLGPFECPHLCFTQMDVVVKCSEMALTFLNRMGFTQQPI